MNTTFQKSIIVLISLLGGLFFTQSVVYAQADSIHIKVNSHHFNVDSSHVKVDSIPVKVDSVLSKADSIAVYYFTSSLDSLKENRFHELDTTLTYFHQYSPIQKHNRLIASLGNIGLANSSRVFSPTLSPNFRMIPVSFRRYMFTEEDIKYYKLLAPYTELQYASGPNKEQNLDVAFSRAVAKGLIIGLQLSIIHSPGAYLRQLSNNNNVYFTSRYGSKDKRYGIIANYLHNKVIAQENGGLITDSIFEQHLETDPKVIPVQLGTAENLVKSSGIYVEQYFNLLKPLQKNKSNRKIDPGNISYTFQYLKSQVTYSDNEPDSLFYKAFPAVFDTLSSYDSIYQLRIRNRFKWSNLGYNEDKLSKIFYIYGGIQFDYIKQQFAYGNRDKTYNETSTFGGLRLSLFQRSILNARLDYTLSGYHGGDFKLEASLFQTLGSAEKNIGSLNAVLKIVNRMPDWNYSYYQSNRFNWDYQLAKEHLLILQGEYQYKGIKAGVHLSTIQYFTFMNDSVKPEQQNTTGSILQLFAESNLMIHHLGINFRLVHQSTTMSNVIHLPLFTGKLDIFYKNWAFKKAARLQTGFQLYYFTSYYADSYMPELRIFYLQNQKKIGDYLYLDVYATLKVKTLRIFLKVNNVLGYSGNYNYFDSPHYPAESPGIFLGLNWRFHN